MLAKDEVLFFELDSYSPLYFIDSGYTSTKPTAQPATAQPAAAQPATALHGQPLHSQPLHYTGSHCQPHE